MVLLNSSEQSVHKIFFKSQGPHCQVRTNKHSPISICRWPHLLQVGAVTKDLFAPILSLWQWHWQSPSFPAAGAASHCQTAIQAKSCLLPSGSAAWQSAAVPCYKSSVFSSANGIMMLLSELFQGTRKTGAPSEHSILTQRCTYSTSSTVCASLKVLPYLS